MDLVVKRFCRDSRTHNMDIETAGKLVEKARKGLVEGGLIQKDFVSANELYKKRQTIGKITTATES